MEYIIIGDLHGDITIFFNIINNIFHIDISQMTYENSNNILKDIINSNKIIILLGDIFDGWHEIYDINYYEYNKYNNTNYNKETFEKYKENEFNKIYNIIKILKEKLQDKLILILGNHDIRYYKSYDLTDINILSNDIIEYLTFINNNFVLYYNIYDKIICNHYFKFNYRYKLNILSNINNLTLLKKIYIKFK